MAIFSSLWCPRKSESKYKVANVTEDAASLSDGSEPSYLHVKHLTPVGNIRFHCSAKCVVVTLVLIVSLTLNLSIPIYLWKRYDSANGKTQAVYSGDLVYALHKDSLCTPCTSIGVQPESFDSAEFYQLSVHRLDVGVYLCCMQPADGLQHLVTLFRDRYRLPMVPVKNQTDDDKPDYDRNVGAHLYASSSALKLTPPVLSWDEEFGHGCAFTNHDIPINENQLQITKSGLYSLYSFITFKTKQHRVRPDNVVHTINRRNTQLPELGSQVILIDKTTLPEVSESFMTSFLSATVRLRKDDQIFVQVSNLSYVYKFAPSNFFGLYYVGG